MFSTNSDPSLNVHMNMNIQKQMDTQVQIHTQKGEQKWAILADEERGEAGKGHTHEKGCKANCFSA